MIVNKLLIYCLASLVSLNMLYATSLDLNKTTPHLVFHFSEIDDNTVSVLDKELENFYIAISEEFSFSTSYLLHINIYPDIQSFQETLGIIEASPWMVARATSDTIDVVSPSNPGSVHSKESINKIIKLNIVKAILFSKFGSDNVPYWLAYGIGAMKTSYGKSPYPFKYIPSLAELEKSQGNNFNKIDGFQVAYAFAKFIEERFGKEALIDLLSNYDSCKEKLYQSWIESLSSSMK